MNAADKARLEELSLKVYADHAQKALTGQDTDLSKYSIEHRENCLAKALRILFADNVIVQVADGKDDGEGTGNAESLKRYKVVDMARARLFESKPKHKTGWRALTQDVEGAIELKDLLGIDYDHISEFSDQEKIYIYFHEDEFDVRVSNNNKYYHRKDCVERRNKFVIKNIIEYEMSYNFSKYLNLFAKTDVKCDDEKVTFNFDRYCISTVFDLDELDKIFEQYEKNYNLMTAFKNSLDKTTAWVKSVGGFDKAIQIIRERIIEDIRSEYERFPIKVEDDLVTLNRFRAIYGRKDCILSRIFPFVKRVPHLLSYDILYVGEEMSGADICNTLPSIIEMASFEEDEEEREVA